MASPQCENGYTKIANELFDRYILVSRFLSPYENTVWLCILRKTFGFNKKEDWIALSQIENITGIRQPHVVRTKKKLLLKNMIVIKDNKLAVQKNYEGWIIPNQVYPNRYVNPVDKPVNIPKQVLPKQVTRVTQTGNLGLPKQVTTKETITKDNIQKKGETVFNISNALQEVKKTYPKNKKMQKRLLLNMGFTEGAVDEALGVR